MTHSNDKTLALKGKHLSYSEWSQITILKTENYSNRKIATALGRVPRSIMKFIAEPLLDLSIKSEMVTCMITIRPATPLMPDKRVACLLQYLKPPHLITAQILPAFMRQFKRRWMCTKAIRMPHKKEEPVRSCTNLIVDSFQKGMQSVSSVKPTV